MSRICILCNRTWKATPPEDEEQPKSLCTVCIEKYPGVLISIFDVVSNNIMKRAGWIE